MTSTPCQSVALARIALWAKIAAFFDTLVKIILTLVEMSAQACLSSGARGAVTGAVSPDDAETPDREPGCRALGLQSLRHGLFLVSMSGKSSWISESMG